MIMYACVLFERTVMKIQYYNIVKRPENELLKQIVNSCLRSDFHAFFEDVAVSTLWYMHFYILYSLWILEHFISEIKLDGSCMNAHAIVAKMKSHAPCSSILFSSSRYRSFWHRQYCVFVIFCVYKFCSANLTSIIFFMLKLFPYSVAFDRSYIYSSMLPIFTSVER